MTPSATSSSLNIFVSITSLKNSRSFELLLPKPHKELPLQLTKHSNHKFSRSCCTSHTINSFYNFLTIQLVLRISKNHALSCHHCTRRTKNYLRHHQQCVFENILVPLSIEPKNYNILAIVSLWNSLCDFTEPKIFRVVQKITHFCLTVVQAYRKTLLCEVIVIQNHKPSLSWTINRVYCFEICALSTSFFSRSTVKGLHRNDNAKVTHRL